MASEGNGMSDDRIGTAVIKKVFETQLKDVPSEDIPPFTPLAEQPSNEQEEKLVTQLSIMVRIVGDKVNNDMKFQDAIDGMASGSGSVWDRFKKVTDKVFQDGITWERIAVLFYVAGKLALKMVEAHLPQSVRDVLKWTVDFFRKNLLGWIRDHGGWINSFSDLAVASVHSVSSFSFQSYGLVLIFVSGLALGSFVTWRFTK